MTIRLAGVIALLCSTPGPAHRLDEYLQGALISIEKGRMDVELTLTPGIAVFPIVLATIDTDADGVISESERRAYAIRVLADLTLVVDGRPLSSRLVSARFPEIEDMRAGLGEIKLDFSADLSPGGPNRTFTLENHHQSRIAAYQVNCLVPRDPDIRILHQNRNYAQSLYQLDYVQAGVASGPWSFAWWSGDWAWLAAVALLLFTRLAFLWRSRARTADSSAA